MIRIVRARRTIARRFSCIAAIAALLGFALAVAPQDGTAAASSKHRPHFPEAPPMDERQWMTDHWRYLALQLNEAHYALSSPQDLAAFREELRQILAFYRFRGNYKKTVDKALDAAGRKGGDLLQYLFALDADCMGVSATIDSQTGEISLQNLPPLPDGERDTSAEDTTPRDYVGPEESPENSFDSVPHPYVMGAWTQKGECGPALGDPQIDVPPEDNPDTALGTLDGDPVQGDKAAKRGVPPFNPAKTTPVTFPALKKAHVAGQGIFGGRDIVFVHGFDIEAALDARFYAEDKQWPDNRSQFYDAGGMWRSRAVSSWADVVEWLNKHDAANRYLITAWPSTQRLPVAVNAVTTELADAMTSGTNVQFLDNSNGPKSKFCVPSCVFVSHSGGALIVDTALGIAKLQEIGQSSAADNAYYGDLTLMRHFVKFHLSLDGAYGGSRIAPMALGGIAQIAPYASIPDLFDNLCRTLGCNSSNFANLPTPDQAFNSFTADMIPALAVRTWMHRYGSHNDVPTMMLASSSSESVIPNHAASLLFKTLMPGVDDGVVNSDSQCANPLNDNLLPSGYSAASATKMIDWGLTGSRIIPFYANQYLEPHHASIPNYTSNACNPYVSSTGMIQPVQNALSSQGLSNVSLWTENREPNHCAILLHTRTHMGPVKPYEDTTPNEDEEGFINDCAFLYSVDTRIAGDPGRYLDPNLGSQVFSQTKGRYIGPYLCFKFRFMRNTACLIPKIWIWRRTYLLLSGYQSNTTWDYINSYVGR